MWVAGEPAQGCECGRAGPLLSAAVVSDRDPLRSSTLAKVGQESRRRGLVSLAAALGRANSTSLVQEMCVVF